MCNKTEGQNPDCNYFLFTIRTRSEKNPQVYNCILGVEVTSQFMNPPYGFRLVATRKSQPRWNLKIVRKGTSKTANLTFSVYIERYSQLPIKKQINRSPGDKRYPLYQRKLRGNGFSEIGGTIPGRAARNLQ
ncbi:hypothetical protein TNCV_4700631 [Trichonephila clavipes]|nr:hypothetical protein TNCV_4700631 [Trichonephila clavipes]